MVHEGSDFSATSLTPAAPCPVGDSRAGRGELKCPRGLRRGCRSGRGRVRTTAAATAPTRCDSGSAARAQGSGSACAPAPLHPSWPPPCGTGAQHRGAGPGLGRVPGEVGEQRGVVVGHAVPRAGAHTLAVAGSCALGVEVRGRVMDLPEPSAWMQTGSRSGREEPAHWTPDQVPALRNPHRQPMSSKKRRERNVCWVVQVLTSLLSNQGVCVWGCVCVCPQGALCGD